MKLNVVLYEPEIPQNTGNIARTCAATGATLHLIHPLGFSVEDKYVRRAGLDYWNLLDIRHYDNWEDFLSKNKEGQFFFATTKAKKNYAQADLTNDCYLIFGPESRGVPEELLVQYRENNIRIPMKEEARSLNLSNSVAILVYEALRQNDFSDLADEGSLHRLNEPK
jgi:tRNA (cytidine/uridine-2'-O-)-methyltransferase